MKNKPIQNPILSTYTPKQCSPELRSKRKIQHSQQLQSGSKIRMDFKYNFQDYLKMALCKLIPHEGVIVDPEQGCIYGEKDDCVRLKRKVQKEFTAKKYKKVQFKKQVDLDQIEYQLHPKFQAHIFRPGYIERALSSLTLYNSLEYSSRKFREIIKRGKTIILRVKSDFQGECMQKIEQILKNSNQGTLSHSPKPTNMSLIQDSCYEQVIEQQANYYQMKEELINKQDEKISQEVNQTHISIEQSEFNLTQTNSSHFMEDQRDEEMSICEYLSINRSFM